MKREQLQTYFFIALLVGVGALMAHLILPYTLAVAMGAVLSVLFYPLFKRLQRLVRWESLAALCTTVIICLIVIVPVIVVGALLLNEATSFASGSSQASIEHIVAFAMPLQERVNNYLPGSYTVDFKQALYESINWLTRNLASVFASTAHFLLMLFVGLMALYYFLKDGDRFVKVLTLLSPLDDKYDRMVTEKLRQTVTSVVKGTLIIALLQGALAGVGFVLFGLSNPVLWGSVAAIGALVPSIGTAIVLAPAAVYLFATGHVAQCIGLALWGFLVIGLADNLLRPYLVGRNVNIHPLLILLSVLGGISALGPSGILFGPIILSLFLVLCEIYIDFTHRWAKDFDGITTEMN